MGRKSANNLPPGIQLDQNGVYWATLEGADARRWRDRYPGRTVPRRKATTFKDACTLQRQLIRDLERGRDPSAENPKVADWVRTVLEGKLKLAPSTRKRYTTSLTFQIEPHRIGRLRLTQLTHELVEAWVRDLKVQPHHNNAERVLDAYSVRNAFALLRMALNVAVERDRLAKNPCKGVELPRPDDDEIQPLTPQQVNSLLALLDRCARKKLGDQVGRHRLHALYYVALHCGLRQGELFGLRWKDIDLERRELRVAGQLRMRQRAPGKTKHAHRALPLSSKTAQVLEWHKRNQLEEQAIAPSGWNAASLVFCTENGTALNPKSIGDQLDRLLRQAELPDIRFHDLRHTYAALSIAAGVDIYTLSRRMGHSTIAVTADRYGHLYQGHTHDVDALDRLLQRSAEL